MDKEINFMDSLCMEVFENLVTQSMQRVGSLLEKQKNNGEQAKLLVNFGYMKRYEFCSYWSMNMHSELTVY